MNALKNPLLAAACALLFTLFASPCDAATSPYGTLPSANDTVRFDGSAGGETRAWAYPNQAMLEAYLRGTIDASFGSSSYETYEHKMAGVLGNSLDFPNGTSALVLGIASFSYRGHQDVEVKLRVTSGQFHPIVWTTPAELVSASGHRYLR